jgi:hypothetical protein
MDHATMVLLLSSAVAGLVLGLAVRRWGRRRGASWAAPFSELVDQARAAPAVPDRVRRRRAMLGAPMFVAGICLQGFLLSQWTSWSVTVVVLGTELLLLVVGLLWLCGRQRAQRGDPRRPGTDD